MKMTRLPLRALILALALTLLLGGCGAPSATPTGGSSATSGSSGAAGGSEIKIGAIIPYTGAAAAVGKEIEKAIDFAVEQAGGEVNGHKITVLREDETDDPNTSVSKARKLVEQDKVSVIIGPQLAHTAAAVGAYLAPQGIPHMALGASDTPTSPNSFFPGSGRGDAYPTGLFAADELKARKAAIIYMDYLFGQELRDGFTSAFTSKGGQVASTQAVPFGTSDMTPYLQKIGDADVVAVFLITPADLAFVSQYRQAGLKAPVIFMSNAPQEEPLLGQMGDAVLGMYGSSYYSPQIDTPANKTFVEKYRAKYNTPPGIAGHVAYLQTSLYLAALKATGGDATPAKVIDALKGMKNFEHPGGVVTVGDGRVSTHDQYIFKADKAGDRYVWAVAKKYESIKPQ